MFFANKIKLFIAIVALFFSMIGLSTRALSSRLKDVANIKGVRENILIGYGIVVGLNGTGDSSAEVTGQSLTRLFEKLGLKVDDNATIKSKNAAAVIATAKLPPFARVGNKIDVSVSSIGDAKSLAGGMLLVTPLRGGDQNVYAVSQGPVSVGMTLEGGGDAGFPTVGRVVGGATIEKDLDNNFAGKTNLRLSLHDPDFTTAARLAALVNANLGGKFATARDSGTVDVVVPFHYNGKTVELLALLENIEINIDTKAKVVLNERTGTVVMGSKITISPVSISHGDLSIEIKGKDKKDSKQENIIEINGSKVSDLINVLNALGVRPKDLTAIFQTLKRVGALQADLEIM